jgi:hypothetical protein
MFNVWNTFHPEQVKLTINHANSQRFSTQNDQVVENTITVSESWREELKAMPFVSKQKGRMAHLLKKKSKVQAEMKPRKSYDVFDFQPEKRVNLGGGRAGPVTQMEERKNKKELIPKKKIEPTIVEDKDGDKNMN